jgi:hypothetical protein
MALHDRVERLEERMGIGPDFDPRPRPRLQLHEALEAERRTRVVVRDWLKACLAASDSGSELPSLSMAEWNAYWTDMEGLREFDAWDEIPVDRLDARAELLALIERLRQGRARGTTGAALLATAERALSARPLRTEGVLIEGDDLIRLNAGAGLGSIVRSIRERQART